MSALLLSCFATILWMQWHFEVGGLDCFPCNGDMVTGPARIQGICLNRSVTRLVESRTIGYAKNHKELAGVTIQLSCGFKSRWIAVQPELPLSFFSGKHEFPPTKTGLVHGFWKIPNGFHFLSHVSSSNQVANRLAIDSMNMRDCEWQHGTEYRNSSSGRLTQVLKSIGKSHMPSLSVISQCAANFRVEGNPRPLIGNHRGPTDVVTLGGRIGGGFSRTGRARCYGFREVG